MALVSENSTQATNCYDITSHTAKTWTTAIQTHSLPKRRSHLSTLSFFLSLSDNAHMLANSCQNFIGLSSRRGRQSQSLSIKWWQRFSQQILHPHLMQRQRPPPPSMHGHHNHPISTPLPHYSHHAARGTSTIHQNHIKPSHVIQQ